MFYKLLYHQLAEFRRGRNKARDLGARVIVLLFMLYFVLMATALGYFMEGFLGIMFPEKEAIPAFYGIILYFFMADFLVRIPMQKLPTLSVRPYLTLNIRKKTLVDFLNIKSMLSFFNIIPFLFFFPFCFTSIAVDKGTMGAITIGICIFSLIVFNNFMALWLKRQSSSRDWILMTGVAIVMAFGALDYFKIISVICMIIEIKELTKIYDRRKVLDIPFAGINAGEVIGFVGNNGAGKTTLFRLILDLIRPHTGQVLSEGIDVSESDHWKSYTGSYLDEGFLIDYLTPEEYFDFIGSINGMSRQDVHHRLNAFADLFNGEVLRTGKYIRDLSKGNKNKVGIVAAMMTYPKVLVLDEPFASLDPTTQIRLKNIFRDNKARDVTMLLSSHDLTHVTEICDRIMVLEKGIVIKDFQVHVDALRELEEYFSERIG